MARTIADAFPGVPGLLLRSLGSTQVANEPKMKNYTAFSTLGFQLPDIDQQESDLTLILLFGNKIFVRFIEVKRLGRKPWDNHSDLHEKPVNKALEQLEKGLKFLMGMMCDIKTENLDIKMLTCFPETNCRDMFCSELLQYVIDKDDLVTMVNLPSSVMKKLQIPTTLCESTKEGLSLLLKISSRLIGRSSLLHCGYRELSDPMNHKQRRLSHTIEQQRSILDKV